ncbi:(2Fe-2S)-binding protein [Candidatus Woesearchaeota archaeon]|nr:(2Fe-2S)-binding protein [Candidatus Woesearchaeota archaeon]
MVKVKFRNDEFEEEFEEGKPLIEICQESGLSLPFGCTHGNCGTCLIKLKSGELSEKTKQEKITLNLMRTEDESLRLACQCKLKDKDVDFEKGY